MAFRLVFWYLEGMLPILCTVSGQYSSAPSRFLGPVLSKRLIWAFYFRFFLLVCQDHSVHLLPDTLPAWPIYSYCIYPGQRTKNTSGVSPVTSVKLYQRCIGSQRKCLCKSMQRKGRKKESLHLEWDFNMLKMFGSAVTLFYFVLFVILLFLIQQQQQHKWNK